MTIQPNPRDDRRAAHDAAHEHEAAHEAEREAITPNPGRGRPHTIIGAVLIALGIAGIILFFGRDAPEDEATSFAAWNTISTVGSAALIGVGLYLVARGVSHRQRRAADRAADQSPNSTS